MWLSYRLVVKASRRDEEDHHHECAEDAEPGPYVGDRGVEDRVGAVAAHAHQRVEESIPGVCRVSVGIHLGLNCKAGDRHRREFNVRSDTGRRVGDRRDAVTGASRRGMCWRGSDSRSLRCNTPIVAGRHSRQGATSSGTRRQLGLAAVRRGLNTPHQVRAARRRRIDKPCPNGRLGITGRAPDRHASRGIRSRAVRGARAIVGTRYDRSPEGDGYTRRISVKH
jgi:hypothetical protein